MFKNLSLVALLSASILLLSGCSDQGKESAFMYRNNCDRQYQDIQLNYTPNLVKNYTGNFEDCDKAIELEPNNASGYISRANLKNKLGYYEEALKDSNKSIELEQKNTQAYILRGNIYENLKNYGLAMQDYNKAIELNPKDGLLYISRATLRRYSFKDYTGSIEDYNKVIEVNPSDTWYISRGETKIELGDQSGACADYQKASELNTGFFETFKNQCK